MTQAPTFFTTLPSPVGRLLLVATDAGLRGLYPETHRAPPPTAGWRRDDARFGAARAQLEAYFAGARCRFELPLAPEGTPFQRRVWEALTGIACGATTTYGALAGQLGTPKGARAVGLATGQNPVSIIVPCHRLVGADGSLTGYAGGLEMKRWLLEHERRHHPQATRA